VQDINHWYSGDLLASEVEDLSVADSVLSTQQRIARRVLTNPQSIDGPPDYIWNPTYGCGAKRYIGATVNKLSELKRTIAGQLLLEPGVALFPAPEIQLVTDATVLSITIKYVDASTGLPQTLPFTTGGAQ
jgi:hypothetical protein